MYYLADFSRKKGSKDKKKRLIRNIGLGALGLGILGTGIYMGLKSKKINLSKPTQIVSDTTPKSVDTTPKSVDTTLHNELSKQIAKVKKREKKSEIIRNRRLALHEEILPRNEKVAHELAMSRKIKLNSPKEYKQEIIGAARRLKVRGAYFMGGFCEANFARRKGDKDKKKRQSKIGKLFNGELNPATGKHNVTLREPVIKHTMGGAVLGAGALTAVGTKVLMDSEKAINKQGYILPNEEKVKYAKAFAKKFGAKAVGAGVLVGAGLGVKRYLNRRSDIKKYEISNKK